MATYFEVTGNVNKEETVEALLDHKLKNTFVLLNDQPYPGYHYHKLEALLVEQNRAIFLVTRSRNTWDSIIRATEKINKILDDPIDATYANITLFNMPHYAIRIMGLKDMSKLETIQRAYQDEGFIFMKNKKMSKPVTVFFKVKRFFEITEVEKGIYKDKDNTYYFEIDRQVSWEMFRKMTESVKAAIKDNNFDVVNAAFYMKKTLVDVIRVYKPKIDLSLIHEIKAQYQKQMNKYY